MDAVFWLGVLVGWLLYMIALYAFAPALEPING